jgi:hypothetical protein
MECYCVPLRKSLIHACLFRKEDGGQQKKQRPTQTLGQREKRDEIRVEEREEG